MAGKRIPTYYWDTCIMLDHLQGSSPEPGVMDGIDQCAEAVEQREAKLITSVITRLEVLESKTSDAAFKKFASMFDGESKHMIQVTPPIVDEAVRIRTQFPGLSVPDCLHLATAILYEADEFHTRDGSGTAKKSRKLLPYNGNEKLKGLKICIPPVTQLLLPEIRTTKPRLIKGAKKDG